MNILFDSVGSILNSTLMIISSYLPKFIAGLIILLIGLVIASLLKDLVRIIFRYFRVERWLEAAGLIKEENILIWPRIFSELVRWTTVFIFLMSAIEVWGIPKVGEVLGQLLNFLPSVFIAVVLGWAGLIAGRFSFDIVRHGLRGLGTTESLVLGNIAKYSIIFFTILIILTQLGVAADLVKILFTGIIGMLALAFGLAFGLGGQDEARNILKNLRTKLSEKNIKKK